MQDPAAIIERDLVLIGGGHAHVHVLKSFGMKPHAGTRLTLISKDALTPYSGMIPGHLAGHYSVSEAHIDLAKLCRFAGARFYHTPATGLDLDSKTVTAAGRPPVAYDLLSIDIGSSPPLGDIAGAERFALPVKPIDRFMQAWAKVEADFMAQPRPINLAVIGAGAGGVEVALALEHRLRRLMAAEGQTVTVTVIGKESRPMASHSPAVSRAMQAILRRRQIFYAGGEAAVEVTKESVILDSGRQIPASVAVVASGAAPAPWLGETGLPVTERGFIPVTPMLSVSGREDIFAAGDVADFISRPLPKSGVYAVRQGPALAENLRRRLNKRPLRPFRPQALTLALISTGEPEAVVSYGPLALTGGWAWRLKDWIDRRWMRHYQELPKMQTQPNSGGVSDGEPGGVDPFAMRCGGCGAKVASPILRRVLARLRDNGPAEVFGALDAGDDAAVLSPPPGTQLVQSVDHFRAFIDDPYLFGEIAATHCLSDLYAMGADIDSVQTLVTLPYAAPAKTEAALYELLLGVGNALVDAGARLVGGHTAEGAELTLGLAVNGFARKESLVRKQGLRPGDRLILTKALGTGAIFAADMAGDCPAPVVAAALHQMRQSNRAAAAILKTAGAAGLTDITGFGLAGHLIEMVDRTDAVAEIDSRAVPMISGAGELLAKGVRSSLHPGNLAFQSEISEAVQDSNPHHAILFDPQTSGGLLAGIPAEHVAETLKLLHEAGYAAAADIGQVQQQALQSPCVFSTKLRIK